MKIAKLLAGDLGVRLELIEKADTFDGIVELVKKKEADIGLSKLSITSKRAKEVIFSDPYLKLKVGIVFNRLNLIKLKKKSNAPFSSELVKAGVLKGTSFADYIRSRFPKANLIFFKNQDDVYKALAKGKVDFTLADQAMIDAWRYSYPSLNLKTNVQMLPNVSDAIGAAVHWENDMLARWLNVFLIGLENSGQLKSMKDKYFANDLWRLK